MIALHPIKGLEKKTFSNNKDSGVSLVVTSGRVGKCDRLARNGDPKGTGFCLTVGNIPWIIFMQVSILLFKAK